MNTPTRARLTRLYTDRNPWPELERLSRDPPADLIDCLREQMPGQRASQLNLTIQLLAKLGASGQPLLISLLGRSPKITQAALIALSTEATPLDDALLRPWLDAKESAILRAAIGAAGFARDPRLVARVFAHWRGEHRLDVALSLARMGAKEHTGDLVDLLAGRLGDLTPTQWEFAAVALESMADPASIPPLRQLLRTAPEARVWSIVQILRAASGEDRLADWISPEQAYDVEALRRAWLVETPPPPGVRQVRTSGAYLAEILLSATSRVRMGYPQTVGAGSWPRWSRALYIDGQILYHANSDCPTCETFLAWAGAKRPRVDAARVGQALAHVPALDEAWLRRIEPALLPLPSGRALVALVEVPLERIDAGDKERSWYAARGRYRVSDDPDDDDDDDDDDDLDDEGVWPGTPHYQATALLRPKPPTALTVLPTQPLDTFDEEVIAGRHRSVDAGERPAALALAWFEERYVTAQYPEAVLQVVILDGHHTVEAYTRAGLPARLVLVAPYAFGSVRATRALLTDLAG